MINNRMPNMNPSRFLNYKVILASTVLVAILIIILMTVGVNNAGYRTVVQWPNGYTWVKFDPGWYLSLFGSTTEYEDVKTFDYDKNDDPGAKLSQTGITVRYQDGGLGTIYGKDRFALPSDDDTMIKLHKAFRSSHGVGVKLIKPVTEQATNLTAGLMSSEEAYAEKRGIFIQWSEAQIGTGPYQTKLERRLVKGEDGKDTWKSVPVIDYDDKGIAIQTVSDLREYGIILMGHQITDWDFEKKTLQQISTKREATMAIITAKANAERAKQDAITAEAQGQANVMKAKYEKEVEKERAVVDAERAKEVAVIKANQLVAVAEQKKLEAEQKKFAAVEYKQEQILIGEGDGERKRLVMEADGALAQKLSTYEVVNSYFADAVSKQKWVSEITMGAREGNQGNAAQDILDMFQTKIAKDLSLDMRMGNSPIRSTAQNIQ